MTDFKKINDYFIAKVGALNADVLDLSGYNKGYLIRHQRQIEYLAYIYSSMMKKVLAKYPDLSKITLLDYGAGTGLLSIYSKLAGIGRVIYSDINEDACNDAKKIAFASGVFIDEFESFELNNLIKNGYSKRIDVLAGMDVIEHIYDIEDFFKNCAKLNDKLLVIQVTGANPHNPMVKRRLTKVQKGCEEIGNLNPESGKPADSKEAYSKLRTEMIKVKFPSLSDGQLLLATFHTRGFAGDDIYEAVELYLAHGIWPALPKYNNTCDPLTGNWAERMISVKDYKGLAEINGFSFRYSMLGYNAFSSNWIKKWVAKFINLVVFLPKLISRKLLPLYCLEFEINAKFNKV